MWRLLCIALSSVISALTIIPRPKEMTDRASQWAFGPADNWVIMLGVGSDSVEAYAASFLQSDISKRFNKICDIRKENESTSGYALKILLGKRSTHTLVDQICNTNTYPLRADTPGVHGFIIRMLDYGGVKTALIGSMDGNGAIYGQNSFFQLLSSSSDSVFVNLADIRDWPSIRDRGRAVVYYTDLLKQGQMDALSRGRFSYIDLRNGQFGTQWASEIDSAKAVTVVRDAHTRGMFVWGTVKSGVTAASEFQGRMDIFRRYIYSWGVDGLWVSYDDAGGGYRPDSLCRLLIRFTDSIGLPRENIRMLGPDPEYKAVYSPWLEALLDSVPALRTVRWIWTSNPRESEAIAAESLGLAFKPEYWWNWPRNYCTNCLTATSGYNGIQPLQEGWIWGGPNPDFESQVMKDSWKHLKSTMFWGNNFLDEYLNMGFGLWAWCPESYSYAEVRDFIRQTVFGERWTAAVSFDSAFLRLDSMFNDQALWTGPGAPVAEAESLALVCGKNLDSLRNCPGTLIDSAALALYITAMDAGVQLAYRWLGMDSTGEPVDTQTAGTVGLMPTDDAFVHGVNPAVNYGLDTAFIVKGEGTNSRWSYLKFDLSGLADSTIISAKLKLTLVWCPNTTPTPITAYAVDNAWSETTLTWNNRPDTGAALDTVTVDPVLYATRDWTWDLTAHVAANKGGEMSLCLLDRSERGTIMLFGSRQSAGFKPVLRVRTTAGSGAETLAQPEGLSLAVSPNPFNPTVNIRLHGALGKATASIYSPAGRLVTRLNLEKGGVEWNASGMPSGLYLIKTDAGKQVSKIKAVLLK